jgi:hypothetical protein
MSLETVDDLDSFFDTADFAVAAQILGPPVLSPAHQFNRTLNVVFDENGLAVTLYGDTDVETPAPVFEAKSVDLVDVKRGYTVTFPDLEAHEDGYSKTYKVERIASSGVQTSKVYLKELS